VDNASSDGSLQWAAAHVPSVRLEANRANVGFARAHNQAMRLADGSYYLALNPDVCLAPNYVACLVEALAARPTFGTAGGKLVREGGVLDGAGLTINRRRQQVLRGHGEADRGQYDEPGEVFGIDGAAPLYRMKMLLDIGLDGQFFDETFVTYKEDIDLAWRARLLGWRAWYEPRAIARHERTFRPGRRERANPAARRYSVRNRYLMLLKNETSAGWRRDWAAILFYELQIAGYLLLREPRSLAAYVDVIRLWRATQRKRQELMRRWRVTGEETLAWFR
jgi:GT2 family glycosyltransferase